MSRCLGTLIERAEDDGRGRAVLLSDLHVGAGGERVLADLERVLAAARARAADTRVVILGDLFDLFLTSAQLRMPPWEAMVRMLRETTAAGVPVTVLHGNRDFLLDGRFARVTGCRVVPGGLDIVLGGRRVLCLHGDEFCLRDLGYQRAKRIFRSAPVRAAARLLPPGLVMRSGSRVRAGTVQKPREQDAARYDATADAVGRAFEETGAEVLVFGHVHRAAHHPRWPGGGELWILPAFDEAGGHLVHEGGEFAPTGPDGGRLSGFPPRPLV